MSICTEFKLCRSFQSWAAAHPKARQWLWFAALWLGGLIAVMVLTYPFKFLIDMAS